MANLHRPSQLRFVLPVVLENIVTSTIGLVFFSLIGKINASSLAVCVQLNMLIEMLNALSGFILTGSWVLRARLIGEGNREQTEKVGEQAMLLSLLFSLSILAICLLLTEPILHLLLPDSEIVASPEAKKYYATLLCSFPFLALYKVLGGVLYSAGQSRVTLCSTIALNLVQLLCAYLFVEKGQMGMQGAAYSYLTCRIVGAGFMIFFCLRPGNLFRLRLRGIFRPCFSTIRRIVRLGAPSTLSAGLGQFSALTCSSILASLGTYDTSAFSIFNTLIAYPYMPEAVISVVATTIIGQALGAKDYEGAQRSRKQLFLVCFSISVSLAIAEALLGQRLTSLYSTDAAVQSYSARLLWLLPVYMFFASFNVNSSTLAAGGDVKAGMRYSLIGTWAVRVPLTFLLCKVFSLGALGFIMAYIFMLISNAILFRRRVAKGKWLHIKV